MTSQASAHLEPQLLHPRPLHARPHVLWVARQVPGRGTEQQAGDGKTQHQPARPKLAGRACLNTGVTAVPAGLAGCCTEQAQAGPPHCPHVMNAEAMRASMGALARPACRLAPCRHAHARMHDRLGCCIRSGAECMGCARPLSFSLHPPACSTAASRPTACPANPSPQPRLPRPSRRARAASPPRPCARQSRCAGQPPAVEVMITA